MIRKNKYSEKFLIDLIRIKDVYGMATAIKYGADVSMPLTSNLTYLHLVIYPEEHQSVEMMRLLINAGTDVNNKANKRAPVLSFMIDSPGITEEMFDLVINAGAELEGAYPCLHKAAECNNVTAIKSLIKGGADVNVLSERGRNAISMTIKNSNIEALQALIDADIDVNQTSEDGFNPLQMAIEHSTLEFVRLLHSSGAFHEHPLVFEDDALGKKIIASTAEEENKDVIFN